MVNSKMCGELKLKMELNKIHTGDAKEVLKTFHDKSVHCIVTSPPYYGLRNYGMDGQSGIEKTPEDYIQNMVEVFGEAKRVLKDDGTLWLNIGDSYASGPRDRTPLQACANSTISGAMSTQMQSLNQINKITGDLKAKDLIGIPWMLAFALRADGWYLRQDIIWHKPNPMPESVTDRCTKSHEYIFLLSKSVKYYYDYESIKTEMSDTTVKRLLQNVEFQNGSDRVPFKTNGAMKAVGNLRKGYKHRGPGDKKLSGHTGNLDMDGNIIGGGLANKRSVWTVNTMPYNEAHFATFPQRLIKDMIKAGCPEGAIVLDPFMGAGTTAMVARKLNRNFIGIELNPAYVKIAETRLQKELGMFK